MQLVLMQHSWYMFILSLTYGNLFSYVQNQSAASNNMPRQLGDSPGSHLGPHQLGPSPWWVCDNYDAIVVSWTCENTCAVIWTNTMLLWLDLWTCGWFWTNMMHSWDMWHILWCLWYMLAVCESDIYMMFAWMERKNKKKDCLWRVCRV